MPTGKCCAQAGHAYTDALYDASDRRPDLFRAYRGGGSKVTLKARHLDDLLKAQAAILAAGIPCALVTDEHHVLPPHFDGSPIVTALGVGPCTKAEARPYLKKFPTVKDRGEPEAHPSPFGGNPLVTMFAGWWGRALARRARVWDTSERRDVP
jgi:peptidyl-tRNA hydrolase